jgi:hypothetical protein
MSLLGILLSAVNTCRCLLALHLTKPQALIRGQTHTNSGQGLIQFNAHGASPDPPPPGDMAHCYGASSRSPPHLTGSSHHSHLLGFLTDQTPVEPCQVCLAANVNMHSLGKRPPEPPGALTGNPPWYVLPPLRLTVGTRPAMLQSFSESGNRLTSPISETISRAI